MGDRYIGSSDVEQNVTFSLIQERRIAQGDERTALSGNRHTVEKIDILSIFNPTGAA
jgi:hypothetical protein